MSDKMIEANLHGDGLHGYQFYGAVKIGHAGVESGPYPLEWVGSDVLGSPKATTKLTADKGGRVECRVTFPSGEQLFFSFKVNSKMEAQGSYILKDNRRKFSSHRCVLS